MISELKNTDDTLELNRTFRDIEPEELKPFKNALSEAFRQLRKRGIVAKQNFSCCRTCAQAEMEIPEDSKGAAYYTRQNSRDEGALYIYSMVGGEENDARKMVLMETMFRVFEETPGLRVFWTGSIDEAHLVVAEPLAEYAETPAREKYRAHWRQVRQSGGLRFVPPSTRKPYRRAAWLSYNMRDGADSEFTGWRNPIQKFTFTLALKGARERMAERAPERAANKARREVLDELLQKCEAEQGDLYYRATEGWEDDRTRASDMLDAMLVVEDWIVKKIRETPFVRE